MIMMRRRTAGKQVSQVDSKGMPSCIFCKVISDGQLVMYTYSPTSAHQDGRMVQDCPLAPQLHSNIIN